MSGPPAKSATQTTLHLPLMIFLRVMNLQEVGLMLPFWAAPVWVLITFCFALNLNNESKYSGHIGKLNLSIYDFILSGFPPGIVAHARAVLVWHNHNSFCPICGSSTSVEEGGHKRRCLNSKCRSLKGVYNTCYPQIGMYILALCFIMSCR